MKARKATLRIAMAVGLVGMIAPAAADEAKTPIMPLILDLTAAPVESYDKAFNQVMREAGPKPRQAAFAPQVQADGRVQYGTVNVTVKNPCPEGSGHYEPPPLPGRRARR